jgi:hypothetical protein
MCWLVTRHMLYDINDLEIIQAILKLDTASGHDERERDELPSPKPNQAEERSSVWMLRCDVRSWKLVPHLIALFVK